AARDDDGLRAAPGEQRARQRAPHEHPGDRPRRDRGRWGLDRAGPAGRRRRRARERVVDARPGLLRPRRRRANRDRRRRRSWLHQPRLLRRRLDHAPARRGGACHRGADRQAPRALTRGRRVGHPYDRQHQYGAGHALTVPVPGGRLDADALVRVRASFDEVYAARYGYANPAEPVEIVTWKLSAVGGAPRIALAKAATRSVGESRKGTRRAYFPET